MERFIEILSVRRHDLLNHLQVISGYLQLNKPERAREYLDQVKTEMTLESQICSCKPAQLAVELLYLQSQAILTGNTLVVKVANTMENSAIPAKILVALVREYTVFISEFGRTGQASPAAWGLELQKAGMSNLWCFQVPPQQGLAKQLAEQLRQVLTTAGKAKQCPVQVMGGYVYLELPISK